MERFACYGTEFGIKIGDGDIYVRTDESIANGLPYMARVTQPDGTEARVPVNQCLAAFADGYRQFFQPAAARAGNTAQPGEPMRAWASGFVVAMRVEQSRPYGIPLHRQIAAVTTGIRAAFSA